MCLRVGKSIVSPCLSERAVLINFRFINLLATTSLQEAWQKENYPQSFQISLVWTCAHTLISLSVDQLALLNVIYCIADNFLTKFDLISSFPVLYPLGAVTCSLLDKKRAALSVKTVQISKSHSLFKKLGKLNE